jgi:hypothetical protein
MRAQRVRHPVSHTTDMTEGRPLRLIALFALPLLLNNAFQQLYNVVDSIVVGRLIGVDAFAAVGAAGSYYWLALAVVLGFTQGFGALFAQRFGAKDEVGLKRAIAQAVVLTTILSILLTAAFLLLLHPASPQVRTVSTQATLRMQQRLEAAVYYAVEGSRSRCLMEHMGEETILLLAPTNADPKRAREEAVQLAQRIVRELSLGRNEQNKLSVGIAAIQADVMQWPEGYRQAQ